MPTPRLIMLRPTGGNERLSSPDAVTRRELYFFDLYRAFEASAFGAFCFSGWLQSFLGVTATPVARLASLAEAALPLAGSRSSADVAALEIV